MALSLPVSRPVKASRTVVVGLNAALQKRFLLSSSSLIPGEVHRASEAIQTGIGGKGQDVAIALRCLEYSYAPLELVQFVGRGSAGDAVFELLQQRQLTSSTGTIRTQAPMRTCTSIVAIDSTTELVEPSGTITDSEYQELCSNLKQQFASKGGGTAAVDSLCIMGSMPPGCPDETYARLYEITMPELCLIDSVSGLEPLWNVIHRHSRNHNTNNNDNNNNNNKSSSTMLKINASELAKLSGLRHTTAGQTAVQVQELETYIQAFFRTFPNAQETVNAIAITDGAHPAYLAAMMWSQQQDIDNDNDDKKVGPMNLYQIPVPRISNNNKNGETATKLYPIGAGDAVAAGTLAAWNCLVLHSSNDNDNNNDGLPLAPLVRETRHRLLMTTIDMHMETATLLTSVWFGICCGTASCLQAENSVLKQDHVEQFLRTMTFNPELVSSATSSRRSRTDNI